MTELLCSQVSLGGKGCGVEQVGQVEGEIIDEPMGKLSLGSVGDCVTAIIVTSPARSHPSTDLIDEVIKSLAYVKGCSNSKIIIVFDGYVDAKGRKKFSTKKGFADEDLVQKYSLYKECIREKYCKSHCGRFSALELMEHHGFAFAVKQGLLACTTKYAIICQRDRSFQAEFENLDVVIDFMENNPNIRYAGFPTVTSRNHECTLNCMYKLHCLTDRCKLRAPPPAAGEGGNGRNNMSLQPCIFWYDSNHVCHVKRYLEIYHPWVFFTPDIRDKIGLKHIKLLRLRKGDFVEDRFGQTQRKLLAQIFNPNTAEPGGGGAKDREDLFYKIFETFGSYLIWEIEDEEKKLASAKPGDPELKPIEFVRHLRGRSYQGWETYVKNQ